MRIRPATDLDWPQIFPFFATIVQAGESFAYPAGLSSGRAGELWMQRPPGRTVVAERGGRIVGSAKTGPNRPGRGGHVATASFIVDPAAAGGGIGRALGEHVIGWSRDAGHRAVQFNAVVETNTDSDSDSDADSAGGTDAR